MFVVASADGTGLELHDVKYSIRVISDPESSHVTQRRNVEHLVHVQSAVTIHDAKVPTRVVSITKKKSTLEQSIIIIISGRSLNWSSIDHHYYHHHHHRVTHAAHQSSCTHHSSSSIHHASSSIIIRDQSSSSSSFIRDRDDLLKCTRRATQKSTSDNYSVMS